MSTSDDPFLVPKSACKEQLLCTVPSYSHRGIRFFRFRPSGILKRANVHAGRKACDARCSCMLALRSRSRVCRQMRTVYFLVLLGTLRTRVKSIGRKAKHDMLCFTDSPTPSTSRAHLAFRQSYSYGKAMNKAKLRLTLLSLVTAPTTTGLSHFTRPHSEVKHHPARTHIMIQVLS